MNNSERIRARRAGGTETEAETTVRPSIFKSKTAMIIAYMVLALGLSVLIGGAVTYLVTYDGTGTVYAAPLDTSAVTETAPTLTPGAAPTPADLPKAPGGEWTQESCTEAGAQISAAQASFWTNPQGSGCNILTGDGTWTTLP